MKYLLYFIIALLPFSTLADSGGDEPSQTRFTIKSNEPNLNLIYTGIDDTLGYYSGKKFYKKHITSNVAVFSIANKSINYVFKDTVKRAIVNFIYESRYYEDLKTIEFNDAHDPGYNDYGRNGLYMYSNNKLFAKRELSNNIIILTEDRNNNITLWICDKYGNNLTKQKEFSADWDWEIDVKNQVIVFSRQVRLKIEFETFKY